MENNNQNFSLYNRIFTFDSYIRNNVVCLIPNVNRDIRIHLLDEVYNLGKNMFYATYNKGNIRYKYLIEMQVNVSLIDMLLNKIRLMDGVNIKKVNSSISMLGYIKNIIYGWKNNEDNKRK